MRRLTNPLPFSAFLAPEATLHFLTAGADLLDSLLTAERRSEDVSEDVAHELHRRCDLQMCDLPASLLDFVNATKGLINAS